MGVGTSKYGNVRTTYNGRNYDSIREANHAKKLEAMRLAVEPRHRVASINYQYRIPILVNNVKVAHYVADFYLVFADGHKEIHEVKGVKTAVYILKKKLVEAIYNAKILEF